MVKNTYVVEESETPHFVIFDSHIASLFKFYVLSDNPIVLGNYHDQLRVGSKDDSHNAVILTKPIGRGWCAIIRIDFVIDGLSSCI